MRRESNEGIGREQRKKKEVSQGMARRFGVKICNYAL